MGIKQIIVVSAVIIQKNKILLQRRIDVFKYVNGKWTMPSGKVDINERPEDAVVREVKEELGVESKVLAVIPSIDSFPNHKHKYHVIYLCYLCKIVKGKPYNTGVDGNISELDWFDINSLSKVDLLRGTMPPIKMVLESKELSRLAGISRS